MKRVCIVRQAYYPEKPPTKRDAETLVAEGYHVDVICPRDEGEPSVEVINGVNVHRLPLGHRRRGALRYVFEYGAFFLMASWKLGVMSLRKRYDVIEVNSMPEFLVFCTLLPKLMGSAVALNWLDRVVSLFVSRFKMSRRHPVVKLLQVVEHASFIYADHLIVRNQVSMDFMERLRINLSKVTIVLNVPGEDIFNPDAVPARKRTDGHFRLLTHGSLLEQYGVQTLIKAVPLLLSDIPDMDVKIVGDGEYRPELERLTDELGLRERVSFTGFVPMETIPGHIVDADIGVVSILVGMMPNKLFEYAALGLPAVVSNFEGIKHYFGEDAVVYFETGDEQALARCILDLYRSPEAREKLGSTARETFKTYRWAEQKHQYLGAYAELSGGAESPEAAPSSPGVSTGPARRDHEQ